MIQKILITIFIIFIFLFGIRFLKKISILNNSRSENDKNDEDIIDLQKDPKTNEYKPKQKP